VNLSALIYPFSRSQGRAAALRLLCTCLSEQIDQERRHNLLQTLNSNTFRWTEFVDLATDQLVAPSVAYKFQQHGLRSNLPDAIDSYFSAMLRLNRVHNAPLCGESIDIARALNEIDVVPIFFKGAASLLAGLYADAGFRVMSDLDVLVPTARGSDCVKRLTALGYVAEQTPRHPRDQCFCTLYPVHNSAPIDLHRDVLAYPYEKLLPPDDIFAQAIEQRRDGALFAILSPTHQAVINVAHAQLHHNHGYLYGRLALRALVDFSLIVHQWRAQIDWQEIEHRFAAARRRAALDFHCLAARELLGTTLPKRLGAGLTARLALRRAIFLTAHHTLLGIGDRLLRVVLLLRRELSSADLRKRLRSNMRDPRWWSRHVAKFRTGGTAATKPEAAALPEFQETESV
jgi:hypothetical protein